MGKIRETKTYSNFAHVFSSETLNWNNSITHLYNNLFGRKSKISDKEKEHFKDNIRQIALQEGLASNIKIEFNTKVFEDIDNKITNHNKNYNQELRSNLW